MWNLQPGQGIGFGASKELAFGLGYFEPEEAAVISAYETSTGMYSSQEDFPYFDNFREKQLRQIHREDEEILSILMQAITSEIL